MNLIATSHHVPKQNCRQAVGKLEASLAERCLVT